MNLGEVDTVIPRCMHIAESDGEPCRHYEKLILRESLELSPYRVPGVDLADI